MRLTNQTYEVVPTASLKVHPKNPRRSALEPIKASIERNGFYGAVIVQRSSGYILAGNHRFKAAIKAGATTIPAIFVDVDDDDALRILLADNRTSDLGGYNESALAELLESLGNDFSGTGYTSEDLAALLAAANEETGQNEETKQEEEAPPDSGIYAFREDAIFASSNNWGIPDLRQDMLAETYPTKTWDCVSEIDDPREFLFVFRTANFAKHNVAGGTLGFYIDDHRFEVLWNDAVRTVNDLHAAGWGAVIAPDFSVWRDAPRAVQLFNIYRSRWCARYWQEAGCEGDSFTKLERSTILRVVFFGYTGWRARCVRPNENHQE